jgi:hypothetical protein
MDFALLIKSVREACQNHLVLVTLAMLGICVFVFIIFDAHRCKKKRPRHRMDKW